MKKTSCLYQVEFNVDEPADTFLDMTGWGKGLRGCKRL